MSMAVMAHARGEPSRPCRDPGCALACVLSACGVPTDAEPFVSRTTTVSAAVVYAIVHTRRDGIPSELSTPPPR